MKGDYLATALCGVQGWVDSDVQHSGVQGWVDSDAQYRKLLLPVWSLTGQGKAWAERVKTEPVPSKVSTPLAPWEGSLGPRTAWAWQPRAGAESSVLLSDCCAGRPAGGAGRGVARKV